jgi:hypothetical protein
VKKQVYVDWDTLNKIIQARKKALIMPETPWYQDGGDAHGVPPWSNEALMADIPAVVSKEIENTKDKAMTVGEQQYAPVAEALLGSMIVEAIEEPTVVVMVVVDEQDSSKNLPRHVHCADGIGIPGYVRDMEKDAYIVDCVDFISLGKIPVSFRVTIPGTGGWTVPVPMPGPAVEKLLPPYYKRVVKATISKYPRPCYTIHYVQMTDCN